jgi:hypothetical protein
MTRPPFWCALLLPHYYHTSEIKGQALQRMQKAIAEIEAGKEKPGEKVGSGWLVKAAWRGVSGEW